MFTSSSRLLWYALWFFTFLFKDTSAQTYTQTLRGKVIDADSKSALFGANIRLLHVDSFIAAATDGLGNFRLEKVPVGRHALKVSYLGYHDLVLSNIIVNSGKEVFLTVELREKVYTVAAVEIVHQKDKTKANNDLVTLSARNFQREETERYAGSRGDPSKMVANYAGVATGNDTRNDIIVRGNSPMGILWRLEGVDIPSPNHFSTQGATGGPVSILNNNLLGNSDFLTGAFPAEYGNKTAAVFDLKLRNGNNEKTEYLAQMGFNGLEAGIEGPLSKKNGSSFLLNYRYSTFEVFKLLGISFGISAIPQYQDLTFKLHFPTAKKGIFSVWGIGGRSDVNLRDSEKDSSDWSFTSKGQDLVFRTKMGALGFSHIYPFNSKLSGRSSFSISGSEYGVNLDTLAGNGMPFRLYQNRSVDGQINANYTLINKFNARHLLKAGINYSELLFNYRALYYSKIYKEYMAQLDERDHAGLARSFIHWQYRINDKLTLNNGLHYQIFMLNGTQSIEPRIGLRWQFMPGQSLNLAYGLHSQTQPLVYYFYKTYHPLSNTYSKTNQQLGFTKSQHFIGGYDFNFSEDWRLKVEGYYQHLNAIPVETKNSSFSMVNAGSDIEGLPLEDSLINKGTGYNYGTEITFEKFFSKRYYLLSTLSLYESKYKGSDNIQHHSAFSGGYVFNVLGGIEFALGKGNKILAFDSKVTLAGGNRYTPIDIFASLLQNKSVYLENMAFSRKLKSYSKIDMKTSFRFNRKKLTQTISVNVENILDRKNVLRQVYDESTGKIIQEYQLGLFPYGVYRIEF